MLWEFEGATFATRSEMCAARRTHTLPPCRPQLVRSRLTPPPGREQLARGPRQGPSTPGRFAALRSG